MKKLFIIAAAACVTLASCVKNEPVAAPEFGDEISFESPVLAPAVKADPELADLPTTETFVVWAHPTAAEWGTGSTLGTAYMNGVEVSYQTSVWKASSGKYYWPKSGFLQFSAYTPKVTDDGFVANVDNEGITFTNYVAKNDTPRDLMFSERAYDKKANDVAIVFNHALSAINFTFAKTTDANFTIKSVVINGVGSKANFDQNLQIAADAETTVASWTTPSVPANYSVFSGTFEVPSTADAPTYTEWYLIPQAFADDSEAAIVVTYTQAGYGETLFTATHKLAESTWVIGNRYTYNVSFGATEIQFAPKESGWATGTVSNQPSIQ